MSGLQNPAPAKHAESLSGLIDRVTFFNEETGYAVLKVKARGRREHVTLVGSQPSFSAGEWLTAEGWWVTQGKRLVVLIGQRKALAMVVKNNKTGHRFSGLLARLTT